MEAVPPSPAPPAVSEQLTLNAPTRCDAAQPSSQPSRPPVSASPALQSLTPKRVRRPSRRSLDAADAINMPMTGPIAYRMLENGKVSAAQAKSRPSRATGAEGPKKRGRPRGRPRKRPRVQPADVSEGGRLEAESGDDAWVEVGAGNGLLNERQVQAIAQYDSIGSVNPYSFSMPSEARSGWHGKDDADIEMERQAHQFKRFRSTGERTVDEDSILRCWSYKGYRSTLRERIEKFQRDRNEAILDVFGRDDLFIGDVEEVSLCSYATENSCPLDTPIHDNSSYGDSGAKDRRSGGAKDRRSGGAKDRRSDGADLPQQEDDRNDHSDAKRCSNDGAGTSNLPPAGKDAFVLHLSDGADSETSLQRMIEKVSEQSLRNTEDESKLDDEVKVPDSALIVPSQEESLPSEKSEGEQRIQGQQLEGVQCPLNQRVSTDALSVPNISKAEKESIVLPPPTKRRRKPSLQTELNDIREEVPLRTCSSPDVRPRGCSEKSGSKDYSRQNAFSPHPQADDPKQELATSNDSDGTHAETTQQSEEREIQNEEKESSRPTPSYCKYRTAEGSQDTTKCSEEGMDGSSNPNSPTPNTARVHDPNNLEISHTSGQTAEADGINSDSFLNSIESQAVCQLYRAKDNWHKRARLIREAGPKILRRQLTQDLRQSLREDLILEVNSEDQLLKLAKRCHSANFLKAADELCRRLERLDVHGCFSGIVDDDFSPLDLRSIRVELESGEVYTIEGIAKKFRMICADLIQFYQGNAMQNEAFLLSHYGEEVIHNFRGECLSLLNEERKLTRISQICEKAQQIGFRENDQADRRHSLSSRKSPSKPKPAIRVSGYQSEVTFLNYRDEKGHSVMGKRHSARVFGVSIDRRTCEARIGNVQDCHICLRKIYRSDGDSLYCMNRALGQCNEAVCRKCLETVFSVSEAEFIGARQVDNWTCVHCQGLCPGGGDCTRTGSSASESKQSVPFVEVTIKWPYDACRSKTIDLRLAKRTISGIYEPWDKARIVSMTKSGESDVIWVTRARLSVGVYRCRVECDEDWIASTAIQVLPQTEPRSLQNLSQVEGDTNHRSTDEQKCTSKNGDTKSRPIVWKVSGTERSGAVHRYCTKGGGESIENCSRTEGYDWRRSKRHTIVQWVPKRKGEKHDTELSRERSLRLYASSDAISSCFLRPGFPKLKVGMTYDQFKRAIDAFRFDHMISETLSGIVAGKSDIHGIGLFTLTGYRKGDFVIEYAGELIRTPLSDLREARYDAAGLGTYFFKIDEHQIVDATVRSNRARFTNHSCDPNMAAQIVHVRGRDLVVLLATRDIPPFSELTFNYQLPYEDKKLQCLCSAWNCVGVMN